MVLIFLPLLGVVMFWFLGRDRVRRPARQKASDNLFVREKIEALPKLAEDSLPNDPSGVMGLAARLGSSPITSGNRIRMLVGAKDTYDAQLSSIENAHDHVHLEYYILRSDPVGARFRDALVRAAERGVRVRVLCDGFGSRQAPSFLKPLRKAGGHVAKFLPLDPVRRAWTINLRNHRKVMVVDGRVGYTGGINIGEEFLDWHDVHLELEGPVVRQLQSVFAEDWYFATRYDMVDAAFFPPITTKGDSIAQVLASGPDTTIESIHRFYFAAITSAQERVYITTPYFVPDRAMLVALQTAALRGVEVSLILPRTSNHRVTFHAGRSFYDELLSAGVRIREYLPGFVHTKTMVVDGRLATVGSANLDVRSFRLNFELIAVIWDRHVVDALERQFMTDVQQTEEVDQETWRKRSVPTRIKEGVGRLCAPLL